MTTPDIKKFESLDEGLPWCDVVISLRSQFERFESGYTLDQERFRKKFRIDLERLSLLKATGLLMHPGPVCWDWELAPEVVTDRKCKILQQVENGVYLREALLRATMGEFEL
jgi:aspartate carbamoyltransferase catalytic subunit